MIDIREHGGIFGGGKKLSLAPRKEKILATGTYASSSATPSHLNVTLHYHQGIDRLFVFEFSERPYLISVFDGNLNLIKVINYDDLCGATDLPRHMIADAYGGLYLSGMDGSNRWTHKINWNLTTPTKAWTNTTYYTQYGNILLRENDTELVIASTSIYILDTENGSLKRSGGGGYMQGICEYNGYFYTTLRYAGNPWLEKYSVNPISKINHTVYASGTNFHPFGVFAVEDHIFVVFHWNGDLTYSVFSPSDLSLVAGGVARNIPTYIASSTVGYGVQYGNMIMFPAVRGMFIAHVYRDESNNIEVAVEVYSSPNFLNNAPSTYRGTLSFVDDKSFFRIRAPKIIERVMLQ